MQEQGNVACHLVHGRGRAVSEFDLVRVQRGDHGDLVAGVVAIVVHALAQGEAGRCVFIPDQKRMQIARATFARLRDHREIRRQRAIIRGPRGIDVGEGPAEPVGRTARTLEHLALVIRPVRHLHVGRHRADLLLGKPDFEQVAVGEQIHRMATRADFPVDLEAALR